MSRKVFLSYAMPDQTLSEAIWKKLREMPVSVWSNEEISVGEDWKSKLQSTMREVDSCVFLVTPNSLNSGWFLQEVGAAWALGKNIVAVVSDVALLSKIPISLHEVNVVPIQEVERLSVILSADTPVDNNRQRLSQPTQEVVSVRPRRRFLPAEAWNEFIVGAKTLLWFYGIAEWGYAKDPRVPAIVREAAQRGCEIRVLLLDPDSEAIAAIEQSERGRPGLLKLRIEDAIRSYSQMATSCEGKMSLRIYSRQPTVSIVRSDERILVTHYLAPLVGDDSPTFEIRRIESGIFDRYEEHFEAVWCTSKSRK